MTKKITLILCLCLFGCSKPITSPIDCNKKALGINTGEMNWLCEEYLIATRDLAECQYPEESNE